jgi:hypothetical protein
MAVILHDSENLKSFLKVLGLPEEPMGMFFTDDRPTEGARRPSPPDSPPRRRRPGAKWTSKGYSAPFRA